MTRTILLSLIWFNVVWWSGHSKEGRERILIIKCSQNYYYNPPLNMSVWFWISLTNDSYNQFLSVEVFLARNKVQFIKLSSRGECLGIPRLQLSDVIKR